MRTKCQVISVDIKDMSLLLGWSHTGSCVQVVFEWTPAHSWRMRHGWAAPWLNISPATVQLDVVCTTSSLRDALRSEALTLVSKEE